MGTLARLWQHSRSDKDVGSGRALRVRRGGVSEGLEGAMMELIRARDGGRGFCQLLARHHRRTKTCIPLRSRHESILSTAGNRVDG